MNNLTKRCLSILLATAIIFSSAIVGLNEIDFGKLNFENHLAVKTKAASVDDLSFSCYDEWNEEYYLADCNTSATGDLVIPSTYNGKPVKYIGSWAFQNCRSLTSITIPDSVISIGNSAFSGCTSLTSVTIPDSVTVIYEGAFYDCPSLTSITIPDGVTSISDHAFADCTSLTSITIPDGVTSIGNRTFYNCPSLTSITIPDSVTSIGDEAFHNCAKLSEITIPESVTSLGNGVFGHCYVTMIKIPESVTNISEYAFDEDEGGDSYSYSGKLPLYCYKNSETHSYLLEKGYKFALLDGSDEENTVGGIVGAYSWSLNKLTGVLELTGSGKMVDFSTTAPPWYEYGAFITAVKLPEGLTNISQRAFKGLHRLDNVVIPDGVTIIDERAFSCCTSLASVTIPDSVTVIGSYAFGENKYSIINPHSWYDYNRCESLTSIIIPDSVKRIDASAFEDCTSLTSIIIPDSVKRIGDRAFARCVNLASITVGDGVTSIGASAFDTCIALTSITIPGSVESIGDSAFLNCINLKSIEFALDEKNVSRLTVTPDIPSSVKEVFLPASIDFADMHVFSTDIERVTICNTEFSFNSSCGLNYNSTIIGFKGSTAEAFAEEIGATFIDIETVHTHNYKSFEEKGYCSFARCTCGKEEKLAHTDSDRNAVCDNCKKNINDINVGVPVKVVHERGSEIWLGFTATQAGEYTLTVSKQCSEICVYDESKNNRKARSYNSTSLSCNLDAGERVFWYVKNVYAAYPMNPDGSYDIPLVEHEFTLTYTPLHKHSYTSKVTTAATCTTNGVRTYTCSCGDSYTEIIGSTGHNYGGWYVKTTGSCVEGTVIQRDCTKCGCSDKMTFAASGKHTEVTTISRATDTHDGSIVKSCSVCGKQISKKTIAKIESVNLSATKYTYDGKAKTPSVTVKDSKGKALVKDKDYTVSYSSGRKNAGIYTVTVKFKGNYGGTEKINFTIVPATPTGLAYTASSTSSIKLSWKATAGATGYIVYKYNASTKKYDKVSIVDGKTSCTVSSLKAGSVNYFKVRAYKELSDDRVIYSAYSSTVKAYTLPAKPTLKVSSGSKGVASLSWTNVAGETGYQVYYSTSKSSGYKKLGTYKANVVKASKSKLTSGKTYYFRVRAYTKTADGYIYGSWSSIKSVKIK